jgi:hypothetical protein
MDFARSDRVLLAASIPHSEVQQGDDKAMDLRQTFRHSVNEPVRVRSFDVPQAVAVGVIRDISDDGMGLALTGPHFPIGSTIELECKDWLLRGAVIFCLESTSRGLDSYSSIGIRIEHVAWA